MLRFSDCLGAAVHPAVECGYFAMGLETTPHLNHVQNLALVDDGQAWRKSIARSSKEATRACPRRRWLRSHTVAAATVPLKLVRQSMVAACVQEASALTLLRSSSSRCIIRPLGIFESAHAIKRRSAHGRALHAPSSTVRANLVAFIAHSPAASCRRRRRLRPPSSLDSGRCPAV
ncbi:hypothetical protein MRX96_003713 [Rhipicephalus microplus]